jgi:hypothetical protein
MAQEPDTVVPDPVSREIASDANASSASATSDEIRSQIEHTRAEMSETIDAIQERLSPSRMMSEATDKVKDATVGRVKRLTRRSADALRGGRRSSFNVERAINLAKSSPVPGAVIGVTVTALALISLARSRNRRPGYVEGYAVKPRPTGIGPNQRALLLSACTSLACWSVWRAQHSRRRSSTETNTRAVVPESDAPLWPAQPGERI